METVKVATLERMVGGLSYPSKMPGLAYGLPARHCILGSVLRKLPRSVCSVCYAFRGNYVFPCVVNAQARRLKILLADMHAWKRAMVSLLDRKLSSKGRADRVFRWHDSGDLQSVEHLSAIAEIAKILPRIRFWLPTREREMVKEFLFARPEGFPKNLTVRISVAMIGQSFASGLAIKDTVASTVGANAGHACPASTQGNQCLDCRACWSRSVRVVDYKEH
jgi:hypothetical protein